MSILSGIKRFKDYLKTESGYQLISKQTTSDSVIFPNESGEYTDDNDTVQSRLGAIYGITDSTTANSSNIALSSKAGKELQSQFEWKMLIYTTGAQTVAIPSDANEIYIKTNIGGLDIILNDTFVVSTCYPTEQSFRNGYRQSDRHGAQVEYKISKTSIRLASAWLNYNLDGTAEGFGDVTETTQWTVCYR